MEKLSTPESRIDEVWILSKASRKLAAILRMSITCSAKIPPRISIPLVVNWSKRWWSSKPEKTTSSDKRSSKTFTCGSWPQQRQWCLDVSEEGLRCVQCCRRFLGLVLLLLLHQAAAVAVVPRWSCVFLSCKRLLGQPTDCDLDEWFEQEHKCFGSVSSFCFISFASSSLSFSLHPLPPLSRSLHLHLHHLQFSPFLNTIIIINIISFYRYFQIFRFSDSCVLLICIQFHDLLKKQLFNQFGIQIDTEDLQKKPNKLTIFDFCNIWEILDHQILTLVMVKPRTIEKRCGAQNTCSLIATSWQYRVSSWNYQLYQLDPTEKHWTKIDFGTKCETFRRLSPRKTQGSNEETPRIFTRSISWLFASFSRIHLWRIPVHWDGNQRSHFSNVFPAEIPTFVSFFFFRFVSHSCIALLFQVAFSFDMLLTPSLRVKCHCCCISQMLLQRTTLGAGLSISSSSK